MIRQKCGYLLPCAMQVMQAVKIKKDTQTDTGNASKITLNLFGGKRLRRSEFFLMLEYIVAEVG